MAYINKDFSASQNTVLIWERFAQVLKDRHGLSGNTESQIYNNIWLNHNAFHQWLGDFYLVHVGRNYIRHQNQLYETKVTIKAYNVWGVSVPAHRCPGLP